MSNYILEEHKPVKCDDILTWAKWFETANRAVKKDIAKLSYLGKKLGEIKISTVFLGIDHNFDDEGDPILFETMVFGGELDESCDRCSTWEAAEKMHELWVEKVKLSVKTA